MVSQSEPTWVLQLRPCSLDAESLDRMAETSEGEEMLSHAVRDSKGSGRKDSEVKITHHLNYIPLDITVSPKP